MLEKPPQGRKLCWRVVAVWTHWAAPSMEHVSLTFPDGMLESQKDPFYLCKNTCIIFTAISCQKSVLRLVRVGERFGTVTPQVSLLWLPGVRGKVICLEQREVLRCLHWENGDICWLRASARDSCQPTSVLKRGGKQFSVGFLSLQAMEPLAASPKIWGQCLLASLAFLMPVISGVQLWRDCSGKGKVKSQEVWVILTPLVNKPCMALSGISWAVGYGDF